jgi:serum/glucocorticoid-regulated kinase 2
MKPPFLSYLSRKSNLSLDCPGGELFYQLKKVRRMTEDQARFYFLEILMGLDHIHKLGVIYRDLKP